VELAARFCGNSVATSKWCWPTPTAKSNGIAWRSCCRCRSANIHFRRESAPVRSKGAAPGLSRRWLKQVAQPPEPSGLAVQRPLGRRTSTGRMPDHFKGIRVRDFRISRYRVSAAIGQTAAAFAAFLALGCVFAGRPSVAAAQTAGASRQPVDWLIAGATVVTMDSARHVYPNGAATRLSPSDPLRCSNPSTSPPIP
jgi:hypothetical protein